MRVAAKMMSTGFYVPIGSGAKFSLRAIFHHRPPYRRFSDTEAQQAGMLIRAPTWRSEEDAAQIAPEQLKRYKENLNVERACSGSQTRKIIAIKKQPRQQ
ncbi:uncharacterized protein BDCG_09331 [Blastomyces dermatitidis ER-3]|uniref:Uncharacterized protein n=2 Tax=Blastomyces TaxID=229219 RepID=A0A179V142_BLAGS|nr:uncharacterized protein BDBG_09143 [Blastomyces gilchristii SLH14081]XP_045273677.1 uncharacterized protein BDCG_09331 [Blastomyces dermatitidis ER-3]EEQ86062.1 hypothetical protein BDCG_09331 [Blastomyces dermatitidis ER-3]OAT14054.1 hypothetical protein BDBG_09143 [Blastomyces gilchristii SLH14081]